MHHHPRLTGKIPYLNQMPPTDYCSSSWGWVLCSTVEYTVVQCGPFRFCLIRVAILADIHCSKFRLSKTPSSGRLLSTRQWHCALHRKKIQSSRQTPKTVASVTNEARYSSSIAVNNGQNVDPELAFTNSSQSTAASRGCHSFGLEIGNSSSPRQTYRTVTHLSYTALRGLFPFHRG